MTCQVVPSNEIIAQWRETVEHLAAETGAGLGLMPQSLPHALHATAQPPCGIPGATTTCATQGWDDWWDMRGRIRTGEVSVQTLAEVALTRLGTVQASTGACVEVLRDAALKQARQLDRRLAGGERLGVLGGMPLAHKDLLHRAGHVAGSGMARALGVASFNATVLERFNQADALDLARLHKTELAFDPSGANAAAGDCRNPWSMSHITGGSSSGSAAVVAAGAVFGALGSDTGGSIRIPAALCGVTGLKPTYGLVSRTGAMSLSATHDHLGPIARSARDCALMLQVMASYDSADAGSVVAPRNEDYTSRLDAPVGGLRIGVPQGYFHAGLHPRIEAIITQSLRSFQQLGVEIREVPDYPYDAVNTLAVLMIRADATALYQDFLKPQSEVALGDFTRARLEEGQPIPASLYLQALALRGPLLHRFAETVLADVDVLLAPVFPLPTPRLDVFETVNTASQFLRRELTRLTRPINYLGLPSLALPGGMCAPDDDATEFPVGFQLIGRPYSEALLLQLGHAFQKTTAWHMRRPPA